MLFHPYSETEAHQESLTKHFQNPVLKTIYIRFRLEYQPSRRNWNTAQICPPFMRPALHNNADYIPYYIRLQLYFTATPCVRNARDYFASR